MIEEAMEAQEEVLGSKDNANIIKGKRTKRQRPQSPLALAMVSSSSSTAEGGGEGGGGGGGVSDNSGGYDRAAATPTSSTEFVETTEEEEDMANCLILLAQGQSRKSAEPAAVATPNKAGFYIYQCRTCNRCFPSFQALGGHRASHKKPKAVLEEKKTSSSFMDDEENRFNNNSTILSLQIANRASSCSNSKSRVHECSVCGAEFTSGQALGGHMRRHRTFIAGTTATVTSTMAASSPESQETKKPRSILSLDLNLPAPEDDHRESKFIFAPKEQTLVFSASSLVDCHY